MLIRDRVSTENKNQVFYYYHVFSEVFHLCTLKIIPSKYFLVTHNACLFYKLTNRNKAFLLLQLPPLH